MDAVVGVSLGVALGIPLVALRNRLLSKAEAKDEQNSFSHLQTHHRQTSVMA